MISFTQKGDFSKTKKFLARVKKLSSLGIFDEYGKAGVKALSEHTPRDSGVTANSWYYKVEISKSGVNISWYNTNKNNGFDVAIMLQYGHGTGSGGYVKGIDYINPAMKPIFDKLANEIWREVTK